MTRRETGHRPDAVRCGPYAERMQLALDSAAAATLSAQQVAEQIGVAERTVRRWISNGTLPAKKTGRSFEIRIEDVERVAGPSIRRRVAVRAEERERDYELRGLQAQVDLLKQMYADSQRALGEAHARIARLEYELELKESAKAA
jgi:excisionase family DNA binding protein